MKTAFFYKNALVKPICGDYCGVFEIDRAVILLLADGHSMQACDWKAARTAITTFLNAAAALSAFEDINQWINCIQLAQKSINDLYGLCKDAATTFSAAIVFSDGQYWYSNIGKNRIYRLDNSELSWLEAATISGFLGQPIEEIKVGKGQLLPGQGLLILSNGIFDHPFRNFYSEFAQWMNSHEPSQNIETLQQLYWKDNEQDISAVMIVVE